MKKNQRKSRVLIIFVLLFFTVNSFLSAQEKKSSFPENHPLHLGNPSNATTDIQNEVNYLIEKNEYSLSYNNFTLIPNWVAWHLSSSDFGDATRSNKFISDKTLPYGWYRVKQSDYKFSAYGFDRGHMCPSADRTSSAEANQNTFYMTNMIPQSPDCNRIVWKDLESYERQLALEGKEIYIFAGGFGRGGTGQRGYFEEINLDNGKCITVPEFCWKIMLILENGDDDISRISKDTKIMAVCIPNQQDCHATGSWEQYECSVNYIEEITHLDFFDILPDEIEEYLEE